MEPDDQPSASALRIILAGVASTLAFVLAGFGIWALGGAIYAAWTLFRDPGSIAYFARYFLDTTKISAYLQSGGEGLAHYVSWIAVILLLLVLGKLGAWAVAAAAQLLQAGARRRG